MKLGPFSVICNRPKAFGAADRSKINKRACKALHIIVQIYKILKKRQYRLEFFRKGIIIIISTRE